MMMPANFSAVAENEMTYVVGGSLVDVLAPAMTTANWQNVSTNVIKIVGNAFLAKHTTNLLGELFDGNYVPGDVIGYSIKNLERRYADPGRPVRYLHPGQQPHRSGDQGQWQYCQYAVSLARSE